MWLQLAKAHAVKEESARSYQDALAEVARAQAHTPPPTSSAAAVAAGVADPMETTARRLRKSLREIDNVRRGRSVAGGHKALLSGRGVGAVGAG